MIYLRELHSQVFAIGFVAGVMGNVVASFIPTIPLHVRMTRHHRRTVAAIQERPEDPEGNAQGIRPEKR
jgi:hypothetical protein